MTGDYTAWLIEISGPAYFQMKDDDDWTEDHDKALHFGRKQDADKVIAYYGWTRARAVEHMWPKTIARECPVCGGLGGHKWNCTLNR